MRQCTHVRACAVIGLVLLVGCDRLFNLDEIEIADANGDDASILDDAGLDTVVSDARCGIDDSFTALDPVWVTTSDPGTLLGVTGNLTMELAAQSEADAYAGIAARVDFTGREVSIEIVQVPASISGAEGTFLISDGGTNLHVIFYDEGKLWFRTRANNVVVNDKNIAFSASTHRYWRIRHVMGSNQVVFETSSDRSNWAPQHVANAVFDMSKAYIGVYGGTYVSILNPGIYRVDDLQSDACFR